MVTVSVSDRQAAEIVTDLGKGMSAVQVASRKHVPTAVVEMLKEQHGPALAVLRAAGKRLHAALRADPVEDLEPAAPESDGQPVERTYTCSWPGCDHEISYTGGDLVAAQQQIDAHARIHLPATEAEPAAVAADEVAAAGQVVDGHDVDRTGGRLIHMVLLEAEKLGSQPLLDQIERVQAEAVELKRLIDEHHVQERRRGELLAELKEAEERTARLRAELADLGVTEPVSQTPAALAGGVWMHLTTEVRSRIRPWAQTQTGLAVSPSGRQPAATVEAYLAAHPEDDPR